MIELARKYGSGPMSLKLIAEQNDLSVHYLEQLASPLRNAGLIQSIRGAYGGYKLAKKPSAITAGDIIRVLEGPTILGGGIENEEPAKQSLWIRMKDAVEEVVQTTTLQDLVTHEDEKHTRQTRGYT